MSNYESEVEEFAAERESDTQHAGKLARHPDPRDPDHPVDCEARAEADAEEFEAMVAEVRSLLIRAVTQQRAGREISTRLALSDAALEINDWLKATK